MYIKGKYFDSIANVTRAFVKSVCVFSVICVLTCFSLSITEYLKVYFVSDNVSYAHQVSDYIYSENGLIGIRSGNTTYIYYK